MLRADLVGLEHEQLRRSRGVSAERTGGQAMNDEERVLLYEAGFLAARLNW